MFLVLSCMELGWKIQFCYTLDRADTRNVELYRVGHLSGTMLLCIF